LIGYEKPTGLPQLRSVEHNIPRGWGDMLMCDMEMPIMDDMPAFGHWPDFGETCEQIEKSNNKHSIGNWMEVFLEQVIIAITNHPDLVITFAMLEAWGVPEDVIDALRDILANTSPKPTEKAVALNLILIAAKKSGTISRDDVRLLRKLAGIIQTGKDLEARIERLVTG